MLCSNKEGGCGWQGELGQLDKHLNVNPVEDKKFLGCACTMVKCLFCGELHQRSEIEDHQTSACLQRPFTCSMCDEYESTYKDVVTSHAPECKCRPVECPNSCGASHLQHQHLEEHMSSQCPLMHVKCEFSDAGCDAKVYRRDLPSHLSDNVITHMSLLARENRKLKQQLKIQEQQLKTQEQQLQTQEGHIKSHEERWEILHNARAPPLKLNCKVKLTENKSEPFYSQVGGYKLQLSTQYSSYFNVSFGSFTSSNVRQEDLEIKFALLESEFAVQLPCKLHITGEVINQVEDEDHIAVKYTVNSRTRPEWSIISVRKYGFITKYRNKENVSIFHITDVTVCKI